MISVLSGLLAMIGWGTGNFLQSIPIKKYGSLQTMFSFHIANALIFVPIMFFMYMNGIFNISSKFAAWSFLFYIVQVAAVFFFFRGLEIGEVAIVTPITAASSSITVILSILFLDESLGILQMIAIIITIIGIVLTSTDLRKIRQLHTVKGVKEAVIAMILFGTFFFLNGTLSKTTDYLSFAVFTRFLLSLMMAAFAVSRGGFTVEPYKDKKNILTYIVMFISFTGAWFGYQYGANHSLVSIVSSVSSLNPGISVLLSVIFLKEKLVFNQKIGIVSVLAGIFLLSITI